MKTKKVFCIIFAIILVAFTLCSCGASLTKDAMAQEIVYDDSNGSAAYVDVPERGGYGFSNEEAAYDSGESNEKNVPSETKSDYNAIADASSRKLIRDASLDVETDKYDEFISGLNKAIIKAGGYIQSASESGNTYNYSSSRYQQMEIRIPAEKLDSFLGSISSLATVTSKQISVKEITGQYISTQSRIKALEAEYSALLKILEKAEKVEDLITIQDRLTSVNADLESNKAQLKTFDEQIAYSTVTMSIDEVERVTSAAEKESFGQEIRSRLSDNLYNISQGARSFAVWFLSSLPYILIFAVIAVIAAVVVRHIVKRKKAKREKAEKQANTQSETK